MFNPRNIADQVIRNHSGGLIEQCDVTAWWVNMCDAGFNSLVEILLGEGFEVYCQGLVVRFDGWVRQAFIWDDLIGVVMACNASSAGRVLSALCDR